MSDHRVEDMKGRLKQAAGDITGDKDLKREGEIDQNAAAAKKWLDSATDAIKDVIKPKP